MKAQFELDVSYGQLAVFMAGQSEPFNEWTQRHFDQGFSWRPRSVSFRMLGDGRTSIAVRRTSTLGEAEVTGVRAIRVPFQLPPGAQLEVASVADAVQMDLPSGNYALGCDQGGLDDQMWCALWFVQASGPVEPAVLRADDSVKPQTPLLVEAEPG